MAPEWVMIVLSMTANPMTASDLQERIDAAEPGAVIVLPAGRIEGRLVIPRAVTLRGAGREATVIDAVSRGPVIAVDASQGEVHLEDLTLTGGRNRQGGGVSADNGAKVHLTRVALVKNVASGQGGAVAVDRGAVHLVECSVTDNEALEGGALFVGGDATASVRGSVLGNNRAQRGGALAVLDGADVVLADTRLEANHAGAGHHIHTRGTSARSPNLTLARVTLAPVLGDGPSISQDRAFPSQIVLEGTEWPSDSPHPPTKRRRGQLH